MTAENSETSWVKVAEVDDLADGRVMTVTAGTLSLALTHFSGQYAAMDNRCPHQGGPLGEGSIEDGIGGQCWLRCPWHGWDFDPLTGKPPGGHEDTGQQMYSVDVRDDGIYVEVPAEPESPRTISHVMADTMVNWGIKRVFGMVGHSNLGVAEALRMKERDGELGYIGIRHEGAAAFACSGYAKLSGKPAACLAIAGPGATNLLTGLWDAKVDRAPALALTGQVNVQVLGPGSFQEIDLSSAFESVAHFSQTVLHSSKHAELMTLACRSAIVNRDVSHLIFPDDVQTIPADESVEAGSPDGRLGDIAVTPSEASIAQAIDLISKAKRPVIIAGYGARDASDAVIAFAERLNAPVLTTFKAKGLISDKHACGAGVLGRSGTPIASWFMNEADLLIALGSSFSDHTGIEKSKPIIQVDFDPMHLGKTHPVDCPVLGDIGQALNAFEKGLPKSLAAEDQTGEIAERWKIWRDEKKSRAQDDRGDGLNSASIFASLTELVPENAVIAVDVGNNTYSFGRYFECTEQDVLMSGYLGSIGFSFPAAMGAWAAIQDFPQYAGRPVVSVSGDGGFGQYMAEFTTAVKYGMNITHILLNNSELGKISKEQKAGEWPVWQTTLHNPSFAAYARLCGGHGVKVTDKAELAQAIKDALAHDGPALVEIISDSDLL